MRSDQRDRIRPGAGGRLGLGLAALLGAVGCEAAFEGTPPGAAWASPSGVALRWVPPGTFSMGSPDDETGRDADEGPVHEVTVDGLWVMETEVTQALWEAVTGESPVQERQQRWGGRQRGPCGSAGGISLVGGELPVVCVDWHDAVRFANALSRREGLREAYALREGAWTRDREADGYRLLTEAEWEYAARAGAAGARFAGAATDEELHTVANVADASTRAKFAWDELPNGEPVAYASGDDGHPALAPVGSLRPNRWGLHDMTGNVWEWTWDPYGPYPGAEQDPQSARAVPGRVVRGGSWFTPLRLSRIADRGGLSPGARNAGLGVRLARPAP